MGKPTQPGLWAAYISALELGMNSDAAPVSLPPNQAAFITNGTVRGNFLTQRSAYQELTLSFTDEGVQAGFEDGLFQGATVYNPDTGSDAIIAAISGRFFKVTPSAGTTALVEEITPTDGGNSPTNSQAWLWQGENFIFWNDGVATPVIYNNQTSIRLASAEVIATVATGTTLAAGASGLVTLTAIYTGQYNVPLQVFDASGNLKGQVQVQSQASGYSVTLTNINDTPGTIHDPNEPVVIPGSYTGLSTAQTIIAPDGTGVISVDTPYTGPIGGILKYGFTVTPFISVIVLAIDSTGLLVTVYNGVVPHNSTQLLIPPGSNIARFPSVPDVPVGTIASPGFTAPAIGGTVVLNLVAPYTGVEGAIVNIDGALYYINTTPPTSSTQVYLLNLTDDEMVVGTNYTLRTIAQLPPGRYGAYGLGRNWIALPDARSYLASDIVGSESGTAAYNFRDSILNVTENNYLAGGGVFRVPSAGQQINSMAFPATLDSSLGQGPLQVLTQDVTFSCNAPVVRAEWQDLTNPIQTQSLVGGGALGDVVAINGDLWFRSEDGIRSLRLARQEFATSWSNTPQSVEMNRVLLSDDQNLLQYWHGVTFDNRALFVANPQTSDRGIYHPSIIALNLDPNSSLLSKSPPVYDGSWDGMNTIKLLAGRFGSVRRCFALTFKATENTIGLSEIYRTPLEGSSLRKLDNGSTRIVLSCESPALFYQGDTRKRELLKLADGEIFVKDLVGTVRFKVEYRPDWLADWTTWHEWDVTDSPTFQPCMGLGTPPITGDAATERPNCVGYFFQLRITITGPTVLMGANIFATTQPVTSIAPPLPGV